MIQSHLYAKQPETPLFAARDEGQLITMLGKGNWLGVFENTGTWLHVLTIQGEGWVKAEHVEERSPFNLHVRWEPGKQIEYVSAA